MTPCPKGYVPGPACGNASPSLARMADGAARREGLTPAQRDAYFVAICASPVAYYSRDGKYMRGVPRHDIGMAAARAVSA